jgi:hypothetical protein
MTDTQRVRRASQLLAEVEPDDQTAAFLAAELSADCVNLLKEIQGETTDEAPSTERDL